MVRSALVLPWSCWPALPVSLGSWCLSAWSRLAAARSCLGSELDWPSSRSQWDQCLFGPPGQSRKWSSNTLKSIYHFEASLVTHINFAWLSLSFLNHRFPTGWITETPRWIHQHGCVSSGLTICLHKSTKNQLLKSFIWIFLPINNAEDVVI